MGAARIAFIVLGALEAIDMIAWWGLLISTLGEKAEDRAIWAAGLTEDDVSNPAVAKGFRIMRAAFSALGIVSTALFAAFVALAVLG